MTLVRWRRNMHEPTVRTYLAASEASYKKKKRSEKCINASADISSAAFERASPLPSFSLTGIGRFVLSYVLQLSSRKTWRHAQLTQHWVAPLKGPAPQNERHSAAQCLLFCG